MAIDDVKFTNLRGEEISRGNLVNEMIKFFNLLVENRESQITDFSEGSEVRNLLESIAVDIYFLMEMENDILKNCYISTATGNWLDRIGEHPAIQLSRESGEISRGQVTFSIPSVLTTEIVIPANTIVVGSNNLYYSTDNDAIIGIGETNVRVNVSCTVTGKDGDLGIGGIIKLDENASISNMVSVTNESAISGGVDYEDDEKYRERLLNFVRRDDFGSLGYYIWLCENVAGVHDVSLVDETGYTGKILVNGDVKPTTDNVLIDVLAVLSDLSKKVLKHNFTVGRPIYDTVDLDIEITVKNEMDTNIIKNLVKALFDGGSPVEGFEFKGLNISQGLTESEIYGLFTIVDNIISVSITQDGSVVTDIPCSLNHVLKSGTINVTQSLGE